MSARTALAVLVLGASDLAYAERPDGVCIELSVDFVPTDALQIVAWLERPDGTYVDTMYITQKTGRYGMGNRPGRPDFNTGSSRGDVFPYGRRIQTFPVWAHRHGLTFPRVVFQNGDEDNLSHPFAQSSPETPPPYCRPIRPEESEFDAGTCASAAFTDKGTLSYEEPTRYPPRSDVQRIVGTDAAAVEMFRALNPFDAVAQPTPIGGAPATLVWAAPQSVDYGDYVVVVEASKTYDFNGVYNEVSFPSPATIPWSDYGKAWRGQPSVVYRVPIVVADTPTRGLTDRYAGYGDPLGAVGTLFPPDDTITTDTPGSGASRMQLVSDAEEMYRVRVRTRPELDGIAPSPVTNVIATRIGARTAALAFAPAGDDGDAGAAAGYEVRVRASSPITDANFLDSIPVPAQIRLDEQGNPTIELTGLLPETEYFIGVRPYDNCFNRAPIATTRFVTLDREIAEVDACFIATAAYGSLMANDVTLLRHFRDTALGTSVLGQLGVSAYYTFGPTIAGFVGESDLLRASARAALSPVIEAVRGLAL
jgi:hypothetical protein